MPDIDSLSIEIKSSSKPAINAINDIITALSKLNYALNNYTDDSDYVKGMNGLVKGLTGISSAVNSIDIEKLTSLTSKLGSLATAGEKLSKLNFVQSFSQLGSELQKTNSAASLKARELAKDFNIPKEAMGEWTDAWEKLYNASSKYDYQDAKNALEDLVTEYAKVKGASKELQEQFKAEQKEFTSVKKYVSSDLLSNYGDNGKRNKGKLNISNTTSNMDEGIDLVTLAKENHMLADSEYEAMQKMTELSDAASDSHAKLLAQQEAVHGLSTVIEELEQKYDFAGKAAQRADEEFMSVENVKFDEFGLPILDETANKLEQAAVAAQQFETQTAEIGNPFEGLVNGLESLKDIDIPAEKFAGISTLAASLSKFGGRNAQTAITVIPQVGKAFAEMAAELAKAPQISNNLVRLAEALSKYSRSAQSAGKSTNAFSSATKLLGSSLRGVHAPTMRAHRGFTSLAAIFGRLYANFFLLIRAARMLGNAMDYSSSMTEAQNVVNVVFGKSASVMDEFAQTAIKDFGMARLSATEFASRFQAMGSTMGLTADQIVKANDFIAGKIAGNSRAYKDLGDSVADMSINLTKLTADMASLFNQDYADVAQDMQAIYTGMTRPLRKYGLDLTQATLKEWAMANGLDADIEKMSQAEKTMLRYQYVMSRAAGAMGDFAKTQDTWANSLRTVKQLLQEVARTIGEGLINAFRPALIAFKKFLFNFLELAENALNAIGKLLGWKQIDFGGASLVEDTEDYAEALDDAAGAAKKLKGQLRGIDELNNLTTNKGGGGGAGDAGNTGADIDSLWDMIKDTEKLYESAISSWREFGSKIAEKIKEGLSSIDWESIYSTAMGAGFNLAEFFNGLIDPETWKLVGKTFAGGLRTAIKFAFSFGSDFDWENLGNAIADGLLGFFEEFDGGELADTIDVWVQGIAKVIRTAWTKLWENKDTIFKDITDFLSHIDLDTVDITIKALGTVSGLTIVTAGLARLISAAPIAVPVIAVAIGGGYLFGTQISAFLEDLFGVDPATGESYWYEWWETEFDFYFNAWKKIKPKFKKIFKEGDPLRDIFGSGQKGNYANTVKPVLDEIFGNLILDTEDYFGKYGIWGIIFGGTMGTAGIVRSLLETAFDNGNFDQFTRTLGMIFDFNEIAKDIAALKLAYEGFSDLLNKAAIALSLFVGQNNLAGIITMSETLTGVGDKFSGLEKIIESLKEKFNDFKNSTSEALQKWFNEDVAPLFTLDKWLGLTENIKNAIEQAWSDTVTFWTTEVPIWWDSNVAPWFTLEKWLELFKNIYTALGKTWSDATTKWKTDTTDFFEKIIKPFFTESNWTKILDGVLQAFKSIWGSARDLAKGFFNAVADFAESFINGVIDGFSALAKAKSLLSDTPFEFNIGHITIPRFANGGYPSVGSLFIAGEAGAEMVGSLNGKTAVASNGEITGIADAIRTTSGTEIELLRQQNVLLQGILEKEFGINKNDLFESVRTSAREYSGRTGKLAF